MVDNTFASPALQQPLALGADLVVHSTTKYLGGHSDFVAGAIIGSETDLRSIVLREYELLGGKMAPFEAWLMLRSFRTMTMRMRQHQENARIVAAWLEAHPKVRRVRWPGLASSQGFALAVVLVMCTSLAYEWLEWAIALALSPEAAEAYNGQQGDPWDAHADMLLATLGALLAWPLGRTRSTGATP